MRFHEPARRAADHIAQQLHAPPPTGVYTPSLTGDGAAGVALLHIERALADGGWAPAHHWLTAAVGNGLAIRTGSGLYHGVAAIAFALHPTSAHPGYAAARATCDSAVQTITRRKLHQARHRLSSGQRPDVGEYDLISGLTGLGAHLRRHDPTGDLIEDVLTYLVLLTQPVNGLPGWWTEATPGRAEGHPPGGHANHGIAHGITGVLALLSLALRDGLTVPGQCEAIETICAWLDTWQQDHHGHPWWPETVSLDDIRRGQPTQHRPPRPSWCYGTPGISRAMQLAALATGDLARAVLAESAVIGCLTDPRQIGLIIDRGLCHGAAGLHMTVASIAADTPTPLPDTANLLLRQRAHPAEPTGFLTGSAGHALALHALSACKPPTTTWDTAMLLR
ncbi:lanthionine synthetase C family protein [Rhizohabitans arisaemae]|uniref:lanthionine synthetase C family protein n=1 Tax=Rhizohabitans arisaemae TaxID=2720610 RepID=UPI0024B254E8|nr:lanthionine synthetase C family protein [Rhizohabitans arisaemae]